MSAAPAPPARIAALHRYPVKSMLGETVETVTVTGRGVVGDRAYALVDQESGKVASAKNPRRWRVLFACRAAYLDAPRTDDDPAPVRITLPDGTHVDTEDPRVHTVLSELVGRAVRLETRPPERAVLEQYRPHLDGIADDLDETVTDGAVGVVAPGTFFDAAPLHVLTTATLARLTALAPASRFTAARFRPNLVVDVGGESGFVENGWVGRSMTFGAGIEASVFLAAPRCVMTTLAQEALPRDLGVLQAIAAHNRFDIPGLGPSSCVGVYALVTSGGVARTADAVTVEPQAS